MSSGSVFASGVYLLGPTHEGRGKTKIDVVLMDDHVLLREQSTNKGLLAIPYPNIIDAVYSWVPKRGVGKAAGDVLNAVSGIKADFIYGLDIYFKDPDFGDEEISVFIVMQRKRAEKAADKLNHHRRQFMKKQR